MGQQLVKRRDRLWVWWLFALFVATYPSLVFLAIFLPWFSLDLHQLSLVWNDYVQTLLAVGFFSLPTSLIVGAIVALGLYIGVSATRKILYVGRLRNAAVQHNDQLTEITLSVTEAHAPDVPLSIVAVQTKGVIRGYIFIAIFLWAMIIAIIAAFQTLAESRLAIPLVVPEAIFSIALLNRTRCEVIADATGIEQRFRWTRKRIEWGDVRLFWKDTVTFQLRSQAHSQGAIPPTLYEVASTNQFIVLRVANGLYYGKAIVPEFTESLAQPLLAAIVYISGVPLREPLPKRKMR